MYKVEKRERPGGAGDGKRELPPVGFRLVRYRRGKPDAWAIKESQTGGAFRHPTGACMNEEWP